MPAKSKAQFRAMQAAAHGHSTLGIPEKVGKHFVAETKSPKRLPTKSNKKYQHSPDTYDDTSLGAVPPRKSYHASPDNLPSGESPQRAGGTPGKVQQQSGTESPRAERRDKSAGMPDTPKGSTKWGNVSRYNDSSELP